MKRTVAVLAISFGLLLANESNLKAHANPEDVVWTNFVNSSAVGNTLIKSADTSTGGATSTQSIASGNRYMEFTVQEDVTIRAAGLSHGNGTVELQDIDFAINLNGFGSAEVWEGGVYRWETTYLQGDVLRVEVLDGSVLYKKNGGISWTTTGATITYPLLVDASLGSPSSTIASARISGSSGGGSSSWPNEPPGLNALPEWGFDQDPPTPPPDDVPIQGSPGWKVVGNSLPSDPDGWVERTSDPGAPFSPANVYDFVYPQGMVEGTAPATVYTAFTADEVYAGFWWKPSSPFDLGPNGNKVAFIFNGGGDTGGQQFLMLRTDGKLWVLPEYPGDFRWREPNLNATVTLGQWHRVEWYTNRTTGDLKWWLDGVLQGSHTDVLNAVPFDMFQFSPTWGGNSGAQKQSTDHFWFDHVHLSVQ